MIVTYNKLNRHIIPCTGGMKVVVLESGPQEVYNIDWINARSYVLDMIEDGTIGEEWVKRSKDDKSPVRPDHIIDPEDSSGILYPASISDKSRPDARKLVMSCHHVPTLRAWMRCETNRPDILILITERLIEVDSINKDEWLKEREIRVEGASSKKKPQ